MREQFLKSLIPHLPDNPVCIEIGCYRGEFSHLILNTLNPRTLFLVDPFKIGLDKNSNKPYGQGGENELSTAYSTEDDYDFVLELFYKERTESKIVIDRNYSYDAVKDYPDGLFDFIYIDACHLYESVKADLNDWFPKLKEGGLIAGHDYAHINDFGVIQAVDEFVKENNLVFITLQDSNYALKRK